VDDIVQFLPVAVFGLAGVMSSPRQPAAADDRHGSSPGG
jgi:hypothetical protein